MKFSNIIEQALNNTSLKRVRMKTDPIDRTNPQSSSPYEGYIIEENEGVMKIMVIAPDIDQQTVMDVPSCDLEPASGKTFDDFKQFVMSYIFNKKSCDHAESTKSNILNASDIQHLEAFMKEQGIERSEFEQITKLFLMS